jgi:hypothetical protein
MWALGQLTVHHARRVCGSLNHCLRNPLAITKVKCEQFTTDSKCILRLCDVTEPGARHCKGYLESILRL